MRNSGFGRRTALAGGVALATTSLIRPREARAAKALTVVLESEVTILDPHLTTVNITRSFALHVFDTLFAMNEKGEIKPQMVDTWESSADKLTWTFVLRDGLKWHDGTPVTAADCVASLKRWGVRDSLGKMVMADTESLEAVDAKTFKLVLKEPFPLLLDVLGKPNAPLPVMMPARLAATPADQRIAEPIGSGPFRFLKDQWRPGNAMVLERNPDYVPRKEAPDFLAGGKNVKIDQLDAARHARPVDWRQRADGGRDRLHAVPALRHAAAAGEGPRREADGVGRPAPVPGQFPAEPCGTAVRQSGGAQGAVEARRPGRHADGDRRARALSRQALSVLLDVRHAAQHRRWRRRSEGRPGRGPRRAQSLGLQGRTGDRPRSRRLDQPDRVPCAGAEHARRRLHRRAAAARLADGIWRVASRRRAGRCFRSTPTAPTCSRR